MKDLQEFLGKHPEGVRKRDMYAAFKVGNGGNKPIDRAVKFLQKVGALRVEMRREGGHLVPYYFLVTPAEEEATRTFEEARRGILKVVQGELPPIDAPLDVQADEMAGLLVGIHAIWGQLAASWLRRALGQEVDGSAVAKEKGREATDEEIEEARDLAAIKWLVGRTTYLEEMTIDMMLPVLLARRGAAARTLEIFRASVQAG